MKNYCWKKDYGDGFYTEDHVLWIGGKPTENVVAQGGGAYWVIYRQDEQYCLTDTLKQGKAVLLELLGLR